MSFFFIDNNMYPDRTQSPEYQIIKSVALPPANTVLLRNGLPLHIINIGDQPVIKLECLFEAGSWYEKNNAESYFATKMLQEGTLAFSASQINEKLEAVGAFLELAHSVDKTGVVVYCLARMLPQVLEVVNAMIYEASFPEKEFEELRNITIQHLKVNEEKVSWVAGNHFRSTVFGAQHPYGRYQSESQISAVNLEQVKEFYDQFIKPGPVCVFLSGQVDPKAIQAVEEALGDKYFSGKKLTGFTDEISRLEQTSEARTLIAKDDSLQSAVRVGRKMFNRHHPDYFKMQVVNEILGGYFGSRLMKNIREEKGLTYGISSMIYTFHHDGFLTIGTDVKREFTEQTIDEIFKEMRILQNEEVTDHELQTVKNYMAGEFAGSLTTAFEIAERRKILILENLPDNFFEEYVNTIHATTASDIKELAMKYFSPEEMQVVVCGGY